MKVGACSQLTRKAMIKYHLGFERQKKIKETRLDLVYDSVMARCEFTV